MESDSQVCVKWVHWQRCDVWYLEDYWDEIMGFVHSGDVTMKHIYRENNAPTDYLAKLGANGVSCV